MKGEALYRTLLSDAWKRLPKPLRDLHDIDGAQRWSGMAAVDRGTGWLSRLVAALIGFPPTGENIPVTVSFRREGDKEIWVRDFGGKIFRSAIDLGQGRFEGLQCERFGPLAFGLAVTVEEDGRLTLLPRRWTAFGIPMPKRLMPRGNSYEHASDGRFNFHVEIGLPVVGLIVRYRGWLMPQKAP